MDKNQKIIIVLLVVAILFSSISIIISIGISNIDLSQFKQPANTIYYVDEDDSQAGSVGLVVEGGER